jgi:hypothetical protein
MTAASVPDWTIGSVADRDIATPLELVVEDTAATEQLKAKAAADVPSIFRFEPQLADAALADFEQAIIESKPVFQHEVEEKFGPLPLSGQIVTSEEFKQFRRDWVPTHKLFPPKYQIARAWAQLQDAEVELAAYRARLRQAMTEWHFREADLDPEAEAGPAEARLVVADSAGETLTTEAVAARAVPFNRAGLLALAKARDDFREAMLKEDWPAARFLGSLMRTNTFFEATLTREAREAAARAAEAPPHKFAAGDNIARAGEIVTPLMRAALTQLRAKLAALPPPPVAPVAASSTLPVVDAATGDGAADVWMNKSFLIGLPVAIIVLAVAVIALAVRLPKRSAVLVTTPQKSTDDSHVVLAMRDEAVQRLFGQRQELIAGQEKSSDQVASIEERVAKLQPQLQAKIRAYESRIRDLEDQLARRQDDDADRVRGELARVRRERDADIASATADGQA